jgi:hypothetical protein
VKGGRFGGGNEWAVRVMVKIIYSNEIFLCIGG